MKSELQSRGWWMQAFQCALVMLTIIVGNAVSASENVQEWRFEVFLDEREIGTHDFRLSKEGQTLKLTSEASFDVRLLFINAFRYRHQAEETWRGRCLIGISSSTAVNREAFEVNGSVTGSGFALSTRDSEGDRVTELPECVQSFAYWDLDRLTASSLLNPQTGSYESVELTRLAPQSVTVGDAQVLAERYQLMVEGKPLMLWYAADDGRWLALESEARGGRVLRYEAVLEPSVDLRRAS